SCHGLARRLRGCLPMYPSRRDMCYTTGCMRLNQSLLHATFQTVRPVVPGMTGTHLPISELVYTIVPLAILPENPLSATTRPRSSAQSYSHCSSAVKNLMPPTVCTVL